jgi:hypothetical protein
MVILRLTKKLLRLVGEPTIPVETSTTRLGDWTGNLFYVGRQRYVLLICEHSRLPVLMPGRDLRRLPQNFPGALSEVLFGLGVPSGAVCLEVEAASSAVLAPTNNRSLLGTLNDFSYMVSYRLARQETDLVQEALWLSGTPVRPLGPDRPRDIVHRLLG